MNYTGDQDSALMLAYAGGDSAAFEVLYRKYKNPMYRFFLRQCSDRARAEELYQELWMRVIRSRESYQVQARFNTWLFRIAHNLVVDQYRSGGLETEEYADERHGRDRSRNPESVLAGQRQYARYLALLRSLPGEQRDVFLLKESGLGIAEIADTIGANVEAVKSRLRYAINKLKQALIDPDN